MKITVKIDGEAVEVPGHFVVCGRCEGTGVHDCWEGGMTGDEMAEQGPEFFEDYIGGMYDTQCTECGGMRVVAVADVERMPAGQREAYEASQRAELEYAAEVAAERRMGY